MVGINMVADLPGSLNIRHVSIQSLTRSDRKARVCCELAHLRDPFQIQDQLFPIPIPVRVLEKPRKPSRSLESLLGGNLDRVLNHMSQALVYLITWFVVDLSL